MNPVITFSSAQVSVSTISIADQYAMARRSGFDEVEVTAELAKRQPEEQWLFRANLWKEHDYQARLRAH